MRICKIIAIYFVIALTFVITVHIAGLPHWVSTLLIGVLARSAIQKINKKEHKCTK